MTNEEIIDDLVTELAEVFAHKRPEWVKRLKDSHQDWHSRWSEVLVEVLEDEYSFETKLINQIVDNHV